MVQPRNLIAALEHQISRVIVGKEDAIQLALIALICRGHVLIEDVPGVGKTTLASARSPSTPRKAHKQHKEHHDAKEK